MLATLWFCLAAMTIAGYVLLDGFDLGAGILQLFVTRTETETSQVLSSIGPVWDGNEVWLIVAGGTLFFAFPVLYASALSGFYLSLMMVLWLLILRCVSIEFRNHLDSPQWQQFWSAVFGLASSALALMFGIALGNVVRGVQLDPSGSFFLPLWTTFSPAGRLGIIDWYTLLVGLSSLLALAVHGSLWVVLKVAESKKSTDACGYTEGRFADRVGGSLQERTRVFASKCWTALIPVMLLMTVASFSIQPNLLKQFRTHPWGLVFPGLALTGILGVRILSRRRWDLQAFLASGLYLLGMLSSAAFGVFPNVLPSNTGPDFSLTIYNASTSQYGLVVGLCWFIPGMALAIAYTIFVYRQFAGKVA